MNFLNPITALVAAGITIPALVALYFLKLRRRSLVVPSTLLWRKAIQDLQVNSPFQKLRKNLLLLLQLLILAALLIALARPTTRTTARPGQKVAILIDHSASMNAAAGSATRLEQARSKALDLIDALDGGEAMVLGFAQSVHMAQQSTGDVALLREAVRSIEPTDERSNLGPALRLIEPFAVAAPGSEGQSRMKVYVLSDGNVHEQSDEPLSLKGAELTYVRIGAEEPAANVGIVSLAARRDLDQPQMVRLFARLGNFGPASAEVTATLSLDGRAMRAVTKTIPAGDVVPLQLEFAQPGAAMVELELTGGDALAADDIARLVLAPSKRLSVLLVTRGNWLLESAVHSAGVRRLVTMTAEKYEQQDRAAMSSGPEAFDVIVFDAYAPKQIPPVDSLSFGSAPPIEGLILHPARTAALAGAQLPESESAESEPAGSELPGSELPGAGAELILDWDRGDPLMRYVVLDDVVVLKPGRLTVPLAGRVLAMGMSGPLIAQVRGEGSTHVVVSFDILSSFWWKSLSFPVFVTNVMEQLGLEGVTDDAGLMWTTGEVATIPATGTTAVTYQGAGVGSMTRPVRGGEAVLEPFSKVGLYATASDGVDEPFDRLAVNLLDARESDLRVSEKLAVGTVDVAGEAAATSVRKEVWRWFAWGALGVLLLEWLVYTRRMHL